MVNNMYERIQQLCKEHNVTITSLCEQVTGSKGNLNTWKRDVFQIRHIFEIAEIFHVSVDYIYGKSAIRSPESPIDPNSPIAKYADLAYKYDKLSDRDKEMISTMIERLSQK